MTSVGTPMIMLGVCIDTAFSIHSWAGCTLMYSGSALCLFRKIACAYSWEGKPRVYMILSFRYVILITSVTFTLSTSTLQNALKIHSLPVEETQQLSVLHCYISIYRQLLCCIHWYLPHSGSTCRTFSFYMLPYLAYLHLYSGGSESR